MPRRTKTSYRSTLGGRTRYKHLDEHSLSFPRRWTVHACRGSGSPFAGWLRTPSYVVSPALTQRNHFACAVSPYGHARGATHVSRTDKLRGARLGFRPPWI